jgi:DNA-directed RNA polymerase subunit RPC12/RpoP
MFRCAYCGYPLPQVFGDTKTLIAFSQVTCPNCNAKLKELKDIEED